MNKINFYQKTITLVVMQMAIVEISQLANYKVFERFNYQVCYSKRASDSLTRNRSDVHIDYRRTAVEHTHLFGMRCPLYLSWNILLKVLTYVCRHCNIKYFSFEQTFFIFIFFIENNLFYFRLDYTLSWSPQSGKASF